MKKLIVVISVALCGCTNSVAGYHVVKAQNVCENHKGVAQVSTEWPLTEKYTNVICNDGSRFKVEDK